MQGFATRCRTRPSTCQTKTKRYAGAHLSTQLAPAPHLTTWNILKRSRTARANREMITYKLQHKYNKASEKDVHLRYYFISWNIDWNIDFFEIWNPVESLLFTIRFWVLLRLLPASSMQWEERRKAEGIRQQGIPRQSSPRCDGPEQWGSSERRPRIVQWTITTHHSM